ncbi:MAG: hypothetical protein LQ352_007630, partial [Teloschistes flavicans]
MSSNSIVTLGHSSPTAIIVAWAFSAFLPLPLIIWILTSYYHHKTSIKPICKRLFHKRTASSHQCPSTPSSKTLTGSDGSPQSCPPQVIPSRTGLVDHVYFSPSTPRNSVAKLPESPRAPRQDQRSPRSIWFHRNRNSSFRNEGEPLSPSSGNPRRLGFLESRSVPSARRDKSYAYLSSDNPLEHSQPEAEEPLPAPYGLRHRRLKHRCITSTILSIVILLLYVLEGFTIVAAQRYANVRVLSQANGIGGLGQGKEDEKWLIPWAVYVIIQGGLVILCARTVWVMRRQVSQLEKEWTKEKGKGVARPSKDVPKEDAFGDIELQPIQSAREDDRLVSIDGTSFGRIGTGKGKGKETQGEEEEVEEPDWETLGFRPTYEFKPPNPPFANPQLHADTVWEDCNPFGEGSSKDSPFLLSPSWEKRLRPSALPVSFLPDNPRESQNVFLHTNCQDWGLGSGNSGPGEDNQETLAVPLSGSTVLPERRNSWAQEEEQKFQAVKQWQDQRPPPMPSSPTNLPSGIELDKPYSFIDGLPYPVLPISSRRHHRSASKPSTPTTTGNETSERENNYIFDMSLPSSSSSFATPPRTP